MMAKATLSGKASKQTRELRVSLQSHVYDLLDLDRQAMQIALGRKVELAEALTAIMIERHDFTRLSRLADAAEEWHRTGDKVASIDRFITDIFKQDAEEQDALAKAQGV